MNYIKLGVAGISGKMGREVVKTLPQWPGIELISAIGVKTAGKNLREIMGKDAPNLVIGKTLEEELSLKKIDVFLDLTQPEVALAHALCAIEKGVAPIIGTSGLGATELQEIESKAKLKKVPAMVVPNF